MKTHDCNHDENGGSRSVERLVRRIHVLPIGDIEIHAAQEICWCYPTETEPKLWVHNAKDCREARERATGEKCSEGWINIAEYVPPNAEVSDRRAHGNENTTGANGGSLH